MEKIEQQEKLPVTEQQIKEFLRWCKKFSGKWKTVNLWPGKSETTFIAYEKDGKKCINAKNNQMNKTWIYDLEKNTISIFHDYTNFSRRSLEKDWEVDRKELEHTLGWFRDSVPSRKEKTMEGIKNLFN